MAIVVALAAGCAGCGADTAAPVDPDPSSTLDTTPVATDPPATSAPTTTTSTTPVSGDEAEVRATIDRYWEAYLEAVGTADPAHPGLTAILFGEAQTRILGGIEKLRTDGQVVIRPEGSVFSHSILTISFREEGIAQVDECVVDDLQKVMSNSGELVDGGIVTSRFSRSLKKTETGWRITTSEQADRREGVQSCDAFL